MKDEIRIRTEENELRGLVRNEGMGAIIRTFGTSAEAAAQRAMKAVETVKELLATKVWGCSAIKYVTVVVPKNKDFPSHCDVGDSAKIIRKALSEFKSKISVVEMAHGDMYVEMINEALFDQANRGMRRSLIISPELRRCITTEVFEELFRAFGQGALVSGMAFKDLQPTVLAGRLANTFCAWDLAELAAVGNFDDMAAQRTDKESALFIEGYADAPDGFHYLDGAGVEEIPPLVKLVNRHKKKVRNGRVIAPILPIGVKDSSYEVPVREEEKRRHIAKMWSKIHRQNRHLLHPNLRKCENFLWGGVMDGYRRPDLIPDLFRRLIAV